MIVLVLLFVIFRLMPGDPTRFFIRPGLSQEAQNDILVSLGFARRVPAPGNGYMGTFDTHSDGVYEATIAVEDSLGRSAEFYDAYTRVAVSVVDVDISATNGDEPWEIGPSEPATLTARILAPPGGQDYTASAFVSGGGGPETEFPLTPQGPNGTLADGTISMPDPGAYTVRVVFASPGGNITGFGGLAVNVDDASPFLLGDASPPFLSTVPQSDLNLRAVLTINVTSQGAGIANVFTDVDPPGAAPLVQFQMFHPSVVVRNNILEEFWAYMTGMLQGDFGRSLYTRKPVIDIIAEKAGPSILLFGTAVIISYLLGILVGAILAWRRGSVLELSSIVVSLFFYSMPVFWFGLILLWAFAFLVPIFPLGGFADAEAQGFDYVLSILHHMALPLLNLVMLGLAGAVLLMRNSMLEVMGEDYITTAKAKGLPERRIIRHARRNALLPVVTAFALSLSGVVSGGVLTETIFSYPGMGAFLVTATLQQDYPSVQGAFFLLALLTIFANFAADILYAFLDPRVRL